MIHSMPWMRSMPTFLLSQQQMCYWSEIFENLLLVTNIADYFSIKYKGTEQIREYQSCATHLNVPVTR